MATKILKYLGISNWADAVCCLAFSAAVVTFIAIVFNWK